MDRLLPHVRTIFTIVQTFCGWSIRTADRALSLLFPHIVVTVISGSILVFMLQYRADVLVSASVGNCWRHVSVFDVTNTRFLLVCLFFQISRAFCQVASSLDTVPLSPYFQHFFFAFLFSPTFLHQNSIPVPLLLFLWDWRIRFRCHRSMNFLIQF